MNLPAPVRFEYNGSVLAWAEGMAKDSDADYIFYQSAHVQNDGWNHSDSYSFIDGDITVEEGVMSIENAKVYTYTNAAITVSSADSVSIPFNGEIVYSSVVGDGMPALYERSEGVILYALLVATIVSFSVHILEYIFSSVRFR